MRIQVRTNDFKTNPVQGEFKACTKSEAFRKALMKLLFFWGLALVSILLPALHFFLVPAFFISGLFFFAQALKFNGRLINGRFQCPACQAQVNLKETWFRDEVRLRCEGCSAQLRLGPEAELQN